MMKQITLFMSIISIFFLYSCSTPENRSTMPAVQPTTYPSPSIMEYFPLKQSAYWVYEGTVKWTKINSSDTTEEKIIWKMEVGRVFQRNDIVGYEMLGAPWDLAWYEEGKKPSEYGIIQAGGRFYRTSVETLWRLTNESDVLVGLVDENEIILDIPLIPGKKFCDTSSIARSDDWYCWVVGEDNQVETTTIKGIDSSNILIEYPVYYQTMPDHSIFHFIPGIGISRYVYSHHGTVSEAYVRLIEFYAGE